MISTINQDSILSGKVSTQEVPLSGKVTTQDVLLSGKVATLETLIGPPGPRGLGWYQCVVDTLNPQIYMWTVGSLAPKWGEGDWLYDPDNGNVGLCTSRTDKEDGSGSASIAYKGTLKGPAGSSIQSIDRTSGTGAPGTTDTYTVTLTNGDTTTFQVYNGKDGSGSGDMTKAVYDPKGKAQDIFSYADTKYS